MLGAVTGCDLDDPRVGFADLSWRVAPVPGSAQRVQVTVDPRGFATGERSVLGDALTGTTATMRWLALSGQAVHEWRVLTQVGEFWVPSASAEFEGPLCAVDSAPGGANS